MNFYFYILKKHSALEFYRENEHFHPNNKHLNESPRIYMWYVILNIMYFTILYVLPQILEYIKI